MFKLNFFKKFFKPEFKSIAGKNNLNLVLLIMIILLSLLTIGFGEGAKIYLAEKMNSPFVSFINVTIPPSLMSDVNVDDKEDKFADKYKEVYGEDSISFYDYFGVKKPYFVYHEIRKFSNPLNNKSVSANIVMGLENDPILDYIIEKDKQKKGLKFKADNVNFDPLGWGCVVTEDFLLSKNKLGYRNTNVSYLFYTRLIDGRYENISIPIQGIVSSLPDNRDMIIGEKLYRSLDDPNFYIELLNDSNSHYLQYFTDDNSVMEYFENYNNDDIFFKNKTSDVKVNLHDNSSIFYTDVSSIEDKIKIKKNIPNENYIQTYIFYRVSYEGIDLSELKERIIFEFVDKGKLGKIEEFNEFLKKFTKEKVNLEIDMSIIESKKNFDLFNRLAKLLSYALIFFSIFTIVIYITNLIVSHISKNKKNLGTLKAFGLSNNHIITIYSTISIILISVAFTLSYLILEKLIGNLFVGYMANYMGITDVAEFKYISYPIYILVLIFIILPSASIFIKLRSSLHSNTPGDLIYGRE
jgi:hypothetical protein